jgi:hypothetical protein
VTIKEEVDIWDLLKGESTVTLAADLEGTIELEIFSFRRLQYLFLPYL